MTGVQTCALPICFPVTIAGGQQRRRWQGRRTARVETRRARRTTRRKEKKEKEEEGRSAASSWTCESRARRLQTPKTKEKRAISRAIARFFGRAGEGEEPRAWYQRRARSCRRHWQRRATAESGILVTSLMKDFDGGCGCCGCCCSCRQTRRMRWTAGRWVTNAEDRCCCCCC